MKHLKKYKLFTESNEPEYRDGMDLTLLKDMGLKLLLPLGIDLTEDGKIINTDIDDISADDYFDNYEGQLVISHENDIFKIDYYLDDDRFLIDDMFSDFDNTCTKENFEEKQLEMVKLFNIKI